MCGRFGVKTTFSTLAKLLRAEPIEDHDWGPDFNIAPTDPAPVLLLDEAGAPRLDLFRWGLVPFWADDPKVGSRMINARADTVADKPAFRESFATRRLAVPASGWFEWKAAPALATGDAKKPQPYWFHRPAGGDGDDGEPLLFAGLWARWRDKTSGETRKTFAIVTTEATDATGFVHDRMPVILPPEARDAWLDPATPRPVLEALLVPYRGPLAADAVSKAVNSVKADGPELIAPIESAGVAAGKQRTLL